MGCVLLKFVGRTKYFDRTLKDVGIEEEDEGMEEQENLLDGCCLGGDWLTENLEAADRLANCTSTRLSVFSMIWSTSEDSTSGGGITWSNFQSSKN